MLTPTFREAFIAKPEEAVDDAIHSATEHPLNTDKWIYRMVVALMGGSLLLMVFYLCQQLGKDDVVIPDVFISIISALVGVIGGILVPSPVVGSKEG